MPGPDQLCEFIKNILCFKNIGGMASFFVNIKSRVCFETVVQLFLIQYQSVKTEWILILSQGTRKKEICIMYFFFII